MRKLLIPFYMLPLIFVIGCVSQVDFEQLQEENDKLRAENDKIKQELKESTAELQAVKQNYNKLIAEKNQALYEKAKTPYLTETRAKELVKDWYRFYDRDTYHKNPKLRRINRNSFHVSLDICTHFPKSYCNDPENWQAALRILTLHSENNYSIKIPMDY